MYTNTSHYGGDAHIWTPEDAKEVAQPTNDGATSLCEHHWANEASDLFHVGDAFPDWRAFLAEDSVCDECAQEWRRLVGEADDAGSSGEQYEVQAAQEYAAFVEYGDAVDDFEGGPNEYSGDTDSFTTGGDGPPTHPNCRASTAEVQVDNDVETVGDARGQAEQRLRAGTVDHEVNIDVEVSGEDARRLAEWLRDRAAEDSG